MTTHLPFAQVKARFSFMNDTDDVGILGLPSVDDVYQFAVVTFTDQPARSCDAKLVAMPATTLIFTERCKSFNLCEIPPRNLAIWHVPCLNNTTFVGPGESGHCRSFIGMRR